MWVYRQANPMPIDPNDHSEQIRLLETLHPDEYSTIAAIPNMGWASEPEIIELCKHQDNIVHDLPEREIIALLLKLVSKKIIIRRNIDRPTRSSRPIKLQPPQIAPAPVPVWCVVIDTNS